MTRLRLLCAAAAVVAALLACILPGTAPASAAGTGAPILNSVHAASDGKVTVSWTDDSTTDDRFDVLRRDSIGQHAGQWWSVYNTAARDKAGTGESYTWTDTSSFTPADLERCYEVVASGNVDFEEASTQRCVTAPAPATSAAPAPAGGKSHAATPGASRKASAGPVASGSPGATAGTVGTAGAPAVSGTPGAADGSSTPDRTLAAGDSPDRSGVSKKIWYLVGAVGAGVLALSAALVSLSAERSRRRRLAARAAGPVGTLAYPPGAPPTVVPMMAPQSAVPMMAPPPAGAPAVAAYDMWTPPPTDPGLPPMHQWGHDGGQPNPPAPWEPRSGG